MGHIAVQNNTPFEVEPLIGADEELRPLIAPIVKATYAISPEGELAVADKQQRVELGGALQGDDENPSFRIEPEAVFTKVATDVVLLGCARCVEPSGSIDVGFKVGPLRKVIRVLGDRWWVKQSERIFATRPRPFTEMPLVYERAFGGWDKADVSEAEWRYEPRNPVGLGFGDPLRFVEEGKVRLPNLEDPQNMIRRYGDAPPPAGFGFIGPNWQPRAGFAGTYDAEWDRSRKPLLPGDFDRRFFNGASPGLVAQGYLRGDEDVVVVNAAPVPKLRFRLPGLPPPVCTLGLTGKRTEVLTLNLDTVMVDTDAMQVCLLWRNFLLVPNGVHDVVALDVAMQRPEHSAVSA